MMSRTNVNNHIGIISLLKPIHSANGFETQAEAEPVMENTINIKIN